MTGNLAIDTHAQTDLSVHDIHSYYGESYNFQGIRFNVNEDEILALLGRHGAGKTSTVRTIARLDSPQVQRGEISLDHQALHKMTSYQATTSGVSLVPEDQRIISGLTVEENLQLAQTAEPIGCGLNRIYDLFPRLEDRRKQEGINPPRGEQQILFIARFGPQH